MEALFACVAMMTWLIWNTESIFERSDTFQWSTTQTRSLHHFIELSFLGMYVSILMTFGCQNVMYLNLSDPFASYATRMNIEYRILKRTLPTLQHICERGFYFPHAACVIFVNCVMNK